MHMSRAALRPWTAAVVKRSAGLCFCDSSGFSGNCWISKFQSSSGFSGAASFTMFKLRVQERSTKTALTKARVRPVAESLLHVGDVVVRCEELIAIASK